MPIPLIAAVATPIAGALAGKVLGPKNSTAQAAVPQDLQGLRNNTTDLLQSILYGVHPQHGGNPAQASQFLSQYGAEGLPHQHGVAGSLYDSIARALQQQAPSGPSGIPGAGAPSPQVGGQFNPSALLPHFAQGGQVPGQGNTDSVQAMLTPGEMVMNKAAVKLLGGDFLQKLNAVLCKPGEPMGPQHYAGGGMVKPLNPGAQPDQFGASGGAFGSRSNPDLSGGLSGQGNNQLALRQTQDINSQPPIGGSSAGGPTPQLPPPDMGNQNGLGGPTAQQPTPNIDFGGGGNGVPAPNGSPATDRLQQYFGNLGVPFTGLQNTAAQSANRMLTQQSPEQRALEAANPFLQQTGVNQGAQNRLLQGATQSGLNGSSQNFFQGLLNNGAGNLGPGSDVESILRSIGQNGGSLGASVGGGALGPQSFLNGVLGQNPAQGVDSLLQPQYQQSLAQANQQGGRFGTANALQRGQVAAAHDADLANRLQTGVSQQLTASGQLGQLAQAQRAMQLQAAMQGTQNQLGAAGQLGGFRQQGAISGLGAQLQGAGTLGSLGLSDIGQQLGAAQGLGQLGIQGQQTLLQGLGLGGQLAGQAGNAERQNTQQGYNIGTAQANQNDIGTSRNLQSLLQLLGMAGGASYNVPTETTPSGAQQGAQFGGAVSQLLPYLMQQQGGGNSAPFNPGAVGR